MATKPKLTEAIQFKPRWQQGCEQFLGQRIGQDEDLFEVGCHGQRMALDETEGGDIIDGLRWHHA